MGIEDFIRGKVTPMTEKVKDVFTGKAEERADMTKEEATLATGKLRWSKAVDKYEKGVDDLSVENNVRPDSSSDKSHTPDAASLKFARDIVTGHNYETTKGASEINRKLATSDLAQEVDDEIIATKRGQDFINEAMAFKAKHKLGKLTPADKAEWVKNHPDQLPPKF